jgi:hypothetical protein
MTVQRKCSCCSSQSRPGTCSRAPCPPQSPSCWTPPGMRSALRCCTRILPPPTTTFKHVNMVLSDMSRYFESWDNTNYLAHTLCRWRRGPRCIACFRTPPPHRLCTACTPGFVSPHTCCFRILQLGTSCSCSRLGRVSSCTLGTCIRCCCMSCMSGSSRADMLRLATGRCCCTARCTSRIPD